MSIWLEITTGALFRGLKKLLIKYGKLIRYFLTFYSTNLLLSIYNQDFTVFDLLNLTFSDSNLIDLRVRNLGHSYINKINIK